MKWLGAVALALLVGAVLALVLPLPTWLRSMLAGQVFTPSPTASGPTVGNSLPLNATGPAVQGAVDSIVRFIKALYDAVTPLAAGYVQYLASGDAYSTLVKALATLVVASIVYAAAGAIARFLEVVVKYTVVAVIFVTIVVVIWRLFS